MNINEDQIIFLKKDVKTNKLKNKKLFVFLESNSNRIKIIFDYIFKNKDIILIFSYHSHIYLRKVSLVNKNFLSYFFNYKYKIISVIYIKNNHGNWL